MKRIETELPEVIVLEPTVFGDERGFFLEAYNAAAWREAGIAAAGSVKKGGSGLHRPNPSAER